MTEMDMTLTLKLRAEIDDRLDDVVRAAKELADEKLSQGGRGERLDNTVRRDLKINQIRNAINVAAGTKSTELVKNFIRYQIGRRDGRGWRHNGFGEALVGEIDERLRDWASDIADECGAPTTAVHIQLVRLYLGYLNRHFVYLGRET